MMEAVILAGGKGTRLREELRGRPKPLVDVGGKPLLAHQLELLRRHGFHRVLVLVNHAAEQIEEFLASKRDWGMHLECVDDGEPRGTAGAVLAVLDRLPSEFLVMYGDTMLNVDLQRFHVAHAADRDAMATLLLHPNDHPADSDLVEMAEDGSIIAFHPYPHDPDKHLQNLVNAALYWVRRDALGAFRDLNTPLDFGKHLFPRAIERGVHLRGYNSPEYIKDAGTPTRLHRVRADLASGRIARASLSEKQAMVFIDRDGTINREVDHLSSHDGLELFPGVESAIRRLNASEFRCCVVTNQPVIARGDCDHDDLKQIHNKLETLLGAAGAYLDRIYYCPHHPDSGFPGERPELKVACACRKPNTGMIDVASSDFNVDLSRSWVIGDSTTDLELAARVGVRSILVETGYAGLDGKFRAEPDFVAADLPGAVDWIIDGYPACLQQASGLAAELPPRSMLFIGGQSRAGKSTMANVIRDVLVRSGQRVTVLSLDRWLRSAEERTPGVRGRYDLDMVQHALDRLAGAPGRQAIELPVYDKLRRQRLAGTESVCLHPEDVVIVEGTLALALRAPAGWRESRLFIRSDEGVRRARVVQEYLRRGMSEAEAEAIYQERLVDEYGAVDDTATGARVIESMEPKP